jgi:polar amino acid transport system substrate-binding protein
MKMFQKTALFFLSWILIQSCGCGNHGSGVYRVGIDSNWYPINFGAQQAYVNAFTEELLLDISRYTGIEFERIPANWDNLVEGLKKKKYDAVLTSLPPYEYNKASFDFSSNFLDLGPVLVVSVDSKYSGLDQITEGFIGVISGDPAVFVASRNSALIVHSYSAIPDLLDAIASGEVEAGLLDRIPAVSYVQDLYSAQLKIASEPLTDAGLHLVTLKGGSRRLLSQFDQALSQMQKKKKLEALSKKWHLGE